VVKSSAYYAECYTEAQAAQKVVHKKIQDSSWISTLRRQAAHMLLTITKEEGKVGRMKLFFAIVLAVLAMSSVVLAQDAYYQFGHLNANDVTVGTSWVKLNTGEPHSFTKNQSETKIEVYVNSRFGIGAGDAGAIVFQVRIDDTYTPDYHSDGSMFTDTSAEFLSFIAVFEDVPAGSHTVSIWAQAVPSGSVSNVLVDPGGLGGAIIVKMPGDDALSMVTDDPGSAYASSMRQNYPNPFDPQTNIEYTVRRSSTVELKIYNTLGQLVRTLVDDYKTNGEYSVVWDGKDDSGNTVPSGSYFYQIRMGDITSTKKMIHVK
jgi:hypothetical protein